MKKSKENQTKACDECGLIHKNGISWHGRCYKCGGNLEPFNEEEYELLAITPGGIEIYKPKQDDDRR